MLRVKQKSIGGVSSHAWQLPVLLNLWLTVIATALAIAVHKRTENGTSLVPFTAATLVVLVCPLSLVWLKLAARYKKPSNAVSKQSRPLPLDGGSRGPPNCKQKSRTAVLVLCSSEKHSYPRCKVIKTVVRVLVILWVLYLLLLLAGDVERNPGPTIVTVDKVDHLAALLCEEAAEWYLFLGQLDVSISTRDQLREENAGRPRASQKCLIAGLHHWVVSDDNPMYEKIIAVFDGRFLTNRPLARKVEEFAQSVESQLSRTVSNHQLNLDPPCEHHSAVDQVSLGEHTLTMQALTSLQAKLSPIAFKWGKIGLQLGFDPEVLDKINETVFGVPLEALTKLLTMWLQRQNPPPTLEELTYVIGGPVIQKKAVARSLREIQSPSSHQQQSLPQASTTDDVIASYADQMRGYYRTSIPQCFSLTWPPPPTRKVFNLSMIRHKQYNYGRGNDELVKLLQLGNVDEIMKGKSNVLLKDLFHLDEAERKVVLIEGAPGAGKSTLAWHICQKWKTGELFQEFNLVVFVQLRDPAIQSAKSLADLFPAQLKSVAREIVSRLETKGGEGLLLVLDGWDEFPPGLRGNQLIYNLICYPSAIAMPSSTLLITSRPIASGDLHRHASARVETIGFKQTELNLYFKEALQNDSDRIQELNVCLKERPVIKASCYLPLNTVIVVHLFLSLDNKLPSTLHGVFLQLVIHCIVRHIMKQQDDDSVPPHISSLDDLPPDMQTQLSHICAMAYHGVIKNKVTFSEGDLKSFNLPPDISTLSLIQVVVSFMPYRSRSYNFLHLSVQELLTSYHISKLPPEEQVKIFKELFGQPRFAAVFQYYAAFTKLQTTGIEDVIVSIIQQNNKDLLLTLLHCLYEAQDSSLCQFVASKMNGTLNVSNNSLSPVDCIAVGYFLHLCATICKMTAKLSECSLDSYKLQLLGKELKRPIQGVEFEVCVDFSCGKADGNLTRLIAAELIDSASSEDVSIFSKLDLSDNTIQDGEDGLCHLCQALTTNTSLVELNLSKCKLTITEENAEALNHMLKTNKTLNALVLSHNTINGRGIRYLSEGISSSAIGRLDLSGNKIQDGEDGLSHLCQALTTNTSLVELNLSDCSLQACDDEAVIHMLETNKTLSSLNMSYNQRLSDDDVACIAKGLRSNHSLKSLSFKWCGMRDTGIESLAASLIVNDSLEHLDLSYSTISPEAARDVHRMLIHNNTLKKLDVSRCALREEAVKSLASALEINSSLEELLLGNNYLTDAALVSLGKSLKRNMCLKMLRLVSQYYDRTTGNSWMQFVHYLKDNHSLVVLETHRRKLDVEGVNTVRREKKLPELRHEDKYFAMY